MNLDRKRTGNMANVQSMAARLTARSTGARADAAERLGLAGDLSAVKALKASAGDRSAEVRMRVIEALGRLAQGSSDEVIAALSDEDELVRVHAAEALSIGNPQALRSVKAALRDGSPLVRSYAAAALGRIGHRKDKAVLFNALRRERNQAARLGYYEGLWMLGETTAIDRVMQLLRKGDYRTRLAAARALASTFLSNETYERIVKVLRAREKAEKHSITKSTIARVLNELVHVTGDTSHCAMKPD